MRERVHAFIESRGESEPFDRLALDIFAYQFERVPTYRRLCERARATPHTVDAWERIPAAPADVFKYDILPATKRVHEFVSSGTTQGPDRPSRHVVTELETYRRSAVAHFADMVLADTAGPFAILVLGPTVQSHPRSSLGQMFSWICELYGSGDICRAFGADGLLDLAAARMWLEEVGRSATPVLILAVSSALSAVLDDLRRGGRPVRLPADSRIVDTGGPKRYGAEVRGRTLSQAGLRRAAWRWLHVPAYLFVNEYGMTEMLSQFYDDALRTRVDGVLRPRAKLGPPWVRTMIVDPATLEPVTPGQRGLLRHFDLANWESISALQTLDVGIAAGAGFRVIGRARAAESRGCSQLLAGIAGNR